MKYFLGMMILVFSVNGFAAQHRGGGDGILQDGNWSLLDLTEKYDATYYFPQKQTYFTDYVADRMSFIANRCAFPMAYLLRMQEGMLAKIYDIYMQRTRSMDPIDERIVFPSENMYLHRQPLNRSLPKTNETFNGISVSYTSLTAGEIIWMMTDKELEEIPDEGTIRLPDGASKKQVAIQKNGVVLIYRPIFEKMDERNKAALILHELLLFAQMHGGAKDLLKNGTAGVRKVVYDLFHEDYAEIPEVAFDGFCGWSGKAFSDLIYSLERDERAPVGSQKYSLKIMRYSGK